MRSIPLVGAFPSGRSRRGGMERDANASYISVALGEAPSFERGQSIEFQFSNGGEGH